MGSTGAEGSIQGLLEIGQLLMGYADSMAVICAVELRIADIIHSHSSLVTLSQIASSIDDSPSLDISFLERIMALLVRKRVFAVHHQSDTGEALYGLTPLSRWLLHDSELSFAPMVQLQKKYVSFWHYLSQCVKEGGTSTGFKKAYDFEVWEYASQNVEFNTLFNRTMAYDSRLISKAVISGYKDGFNNIRSLVDVGGGTGGMAAEIVKFYPHIKAINYDLPHVITTAPPLDGVTHLGGNMFESIPNADAVFLKWILHSCSDKDCIKILQSCRKAIPEKTGKVIIVDVVLKPDGNDPFDGVRLVSDLTMRLVFSGGKERTELEWKKLLEEGGFPTYKIIPIPALQTIIEAYPY
ncbi:hypothetical protein DITRI_Ditri09bG0040700 [Diplodiscus trichospermus]